MQPMAWQNLLSERGPTQRTNHPISFIWKSRKGITNQWWKKSEQWLPWGGWGRIFALERQKCSRDNRNVPCLVLGAGYTGLWASQVTLVVKNPPANAGDIRDMGSILESGISSGGGHGNLLQYSCLENSMDRGAWWATIHRVAKSRTLHSQLKPLKRKLKW